MQTCMVDATRYPPCRSECLAHWIGLALRSQPTAEPSAATKGVTRCGGEPNLSQKTCVSCSLLCVSYIALSHCLEPFILRHPVHVCGLLSLAWLPSFSESVISNSSPLSRPDRNLRLLFFFLPDVCFSNCTRLYYLESYSYNRYYQSFSFLLLHRGKGKKRE